MAVASRPIFPSIRYVVQLVVKDLHQCFLPAMDSTKDTADGNPLVESSFSVDDASPKPIPNGGLLAWLQVAGSFCLYFCTWGG